MLTFYLTCALLGGIVLVLQLILTVTGLVGDMEAEAGHDGIGDHGDMHGDATDLDHVDHDAHHDSSSFFKLLSFRSLIAALTFFGLGGGIAHSSGAPLILTLFFAVLLGGIAMISVAWVFSLLMRLREEGNVHVEYTLGATAVVYLTIPAAHGGQGKVTVQVQNRSMEYNAVTAGEELPTGSAVTIVDIVNETTVEVEKAGAIEETPPRLENR